MRKSFLTLVLAIAAGVWTLSNAMCMGPFSDAMDQPYTTVSGTIQALPLPCEPGEDCPTCLTEAIVTNDKTYYLTTENQQVADFLEQIQTSPVPAIYLLPLKATASGTPYQIGSFDYLLISSLNELSVEYFSDQQENKLPSLCDEWNVLHEPFSCVGIYCRLQTLIYRLTTDTLIQDVNYVKLMEQEGSNTYYIGAMREGTNRDIYYVPANSTHEYLLYAFNAQEGDQLNNVWLGGNPEDYPYGWTMTVEAIQETNPRTFVLSTGFITTEEGVENYPLYTTWIEGVGSPEEPCGLDCPPPCAADGGVYTLLCAYKNGEQVYSSSKSERYGCEFNGIPSTKPYSLCDTWNVMEVGLVTSPEEIYHTVTQRLTKDTIIAYPSYYNFTPYARLEENGKYKGAMREEGYGKIYYIPAGSTHEYLLYNFNAKVGDRLTNLWFGGPAKEYPNGLNATITEISNTSPRVFTLAAELVHAESDAIDTVLVFWTEGVGMETGPVGMDCFYCACSCGQLVLCAYKNGEQVYVSDMGEQYGCVYNYDPYAPSDTIPLFSYTGDDPGSSTVDPVDPNQVVVTLQGDQLTIHENMGVDITYSLNHEAPAQMPSQHKALQSNTFRDEVTIQITESGEYLLQLTNPSWGYNIFGRFNYMPQGIISVHSSSAPQKVLQNGQMIILRGEKMYTVTGQEVR